MIGKNHSIKVDQVQSSRKTYHAGFGSGLHGDLGIGAHFEASIEDAIRDLVAKFVRVTLTD